MENKQVTWTPKEDISDLLASGRAELAETRDIRVKDKLFTPGDVGCCKEARKIARQNGYDLIENDSLWCFNGLYGEGTFRFYRLLR